jgi:hypothetical protein
MVAPVDPEINWRALYARFDAQNGNVFILAGENIQVLVPPSGDWVFINAA